MKIRDRIIELRRVPASELIPNPKNWRTHPQGQQDALRGILAEVGIAGAVLARETPAGLVLIDGHMRVDTDPTAIWPVLVLDVTEAEADKLLVSYDPIAAMAEADAVKLNDLIGSIDAGHADLARLLDELAAQNPALLENDEKASDPEVAAMELRPHEHYDYIVIAASDSSTWNVLCEKLGITRKPLGGMRKKSRLGICRAIRAEKVLELLQNHNPKSETA